MVNPWWQFDRDDGDESNAELDQHEKTALEAVKAIAEMAATHPDKAQIIAASLRKISTVAQSRAQSIGLRPVTVRKGGR